MLARAGTTSDRRGLVLYCSSYSKTLSPGLPGPMFSPSGGYRDFIRLNTGFPWTAGTEQQVATLGALAAA